MGSDPAVAPAAEGAERREAEDRGDQDAEREMSGDADQSVVASGSAVGLDQFHLIEGLAAGAAVIKAVVDIEESEEADGAGTETAVVIPDDHGPGRFVGRPGRG